MGSLTRHFGRDARYLMWVPAIVVAVFAMVVVLPEARAQGHDHDHGESQSQTQAVSVDSVKIMEEAVAADSSYENLYRLGVAYLDRDRAVEAVRIFRRLHRTETQRDQVLGQLRCFSGRHRSRGVMRARPTARRWRSAMVTRLLSAGWPHPCTPVAIAPPPWTRCGSRFASIPSHTAPISRWGWRSPTHRCTRRPSVPGKRSSSTLPILPKLSRPERASTP